MMVAIACTHISFSWGHDMAFAIKTTHLDPTDTKGARIKAQAYKGPSITIGYPYEFTGSAAHEAAVRALCGREGWSQSYVWAESHERGYTFIVIG